MTMLKGRRIAAAALLALTMTAPAESQAPAASAAPAYTYADLADLALPSPLAAHVRIKSAARLRGDRASGVPSGKTRFYVEADVVSLIRSPGPTPARLAYLVDLPNRSDGKPPKLAKKGEYLILGAPVRGQPGEVVLAAPDAQVPWSFATGERVRRILAEGTARGAAPAITGIGRAFHVPGSLPGESETQIFLQTSGGLPVSLNVLRRPGETPRWAVSLSEIVDDAAGPPAPDTLLWYRLACTLPAQLPPLTLSDADPRQAAAIQADYALILDNLGTCYRSRPRA